MCRNNITIATLTYANSKGKILDNKMIMVTARNDICTRDGKVGSYNIVLQACGCHSRMQKYKTSSSCCMDKCRANAKDFRSSIGNCSFGMERKTCRYSNIF